MASCKIGYQETSYVLIYGEAVYIVSYTHAIHANIFSPFLIWNKFTDFAVFLNFCRPYTQLELSRKAKFWEDSKGQEKTQFENKRHKSDY